MAVRRSPYAPKGYTLPEAFKKVAEKIKNMPKYKRPTLTQEELNRYSRGNYGKSPSDTSGTYTMGGYKQYPTVEEQIEAYVPKKLQEKNNNIKETKTPLQFIKKVINGFVDSRTNTPIEKDGSIIKILPGNQSSFLGIPGRTDTGEGASLVKPKKEVATPIVSDYAQKLEQIKNATPEKKDETIKNNVNQIVGNQNNIDENNARRVLEDLNQQEVTAINNATTPEEKTDVMEYFDKLQKEITRRTISQLRTGKEQALLGLGQAQAAVAPQYESQRARAATTSMQQARNFSEYLAARGQSTSGLAAQAELSRGTGLTRQLGEIGQQQQSAQDQLNANKAKIQSDFQLAISNAKSEAEIANLNQALSRAIKQEDRAYSEGIYDKQREDRLEEVRSGREWQLAFADYQNAINRGNTEEARNFQIKMFELEKQATKDLATFKASLEPPPVEKPGVYNYKKDSNFAKTFEQLLSGEDGLEEVRSGREWQLASSNYQDAINKGNTQKAKRFKIEIDNLEEQAIKDGIERNYKDVLKNRADYIYAFEYDGYQEIKKELESALNKINLRR
jgi:hypothetical protein